MSDDEFDESVRKYYQDKMKERGTRESAIYVDLNKLIKEKENESK